MDITIARKRISLSDQEIVGQPGGEGTVYLKSSGRNKYAVKIYHTPSIERGDKISALINRANNVDRDRIAFPNELVYDEYERKIIGFTMPFMGNNLSEFRDLSNLRLRNSRQVTLKDACNTILAAMKDLKTIIHKNNFVVGDLSENNILYQGIIPYWIDVDSWQFDKYPCQVGTESFIAPELYGIDLSKRPVFNTGHDWYSMAVMLFKAILLVHPYGGTHKLYRNIARRAEHKITAFHNDVIYPKNASPKVIVGNNLYEIFEKYFIYKWRGEFPINNLEEYINSLILCKCGEFFPKEIKLCPYCMTISIQPAPSPLYISQGITKKQLLSIIGTIVYSKIFGDEMIVITIENNTNIFYRINLKTHAISKIDLFKAIPRAKFDYFDNILAVNLLGNNDINLIDISDTTSIKGIDKISTKQFAGNRRAIFRTNGKGLYHILGQSIMEYSRYDENNFVEQKIRDILENQTWFQADSNYQGKSRIFGFYRAFSRYDYWISIDQLNFSADLLELEKNEHLSDISVKFSKSSILIKRLTQQNGVDYIITDIIDNTGSRLYSPVRIKREDHPTQDIHGLTYGNGFILYPTDDGVLSQKAENGTSKYFNGTKGTVREGDSLFSYNNGLINVSSDNVILMTTN